MYFVIRHNECEHLSEEDLLERLNNEHYGADAVFIREGDVGGTTSDTRHWKPNWVLIIDGRSVKPEPVKTTVRYEIGNF